MSMKHVKTAKGVSRRAVLEGSGGLAGRRGFRRDHGFRRSGLRKIRCCATGTAVN